MANALAWFSNALRPRKPYDSLGRKTQDGHPAQSTFTQLLKPEARTLDAAGLAVKF